MHPILYSFDGITIYTYGFFVSMGFLIAFVLFLIDLDKRGISVDAGIDFAFWILLSAIAGSRLVYVAVNLGYFLKYPLKILMIWEGGLVWYGAFLGALGAAIVYFRAKKLDGWTWADIAIPYVALGQGIGRIGCLMAGCCYGKPTDVCWGITFTRSELAPNGIALHPTQVYEMVLCLCIFLILYLRRNRITFRGEQILSYIFLYGMTRTVVEVFRGDPRGMWLSGSISTSQLISVIAVAVGVALYYRIREKNRIGPKDKAGRVGTAAPPRAPEKKAVGPKKRKRAKDSRRRQ
jgi:phosphatidylglycerol:prolipoprotein diacylglycerol transferase